MENKGLYVVIIGFIAVVVGLAFWGTIGNNVGTLAKIQTSTNVSFSTPTTNTTWYDIIPCGQLNTTNIVIMNKSGDLIIPAANYSIRQGTSATDGYLVTQIKNISLSGAAGSGIAGTLNITCDYQPRGYIVESGGRAVVLIIPILLALAIAFAASPDMREWFKELAFS